MTDSGQVYETYKDENEMQPQNKQKNNTNVTPEKTKTKKKYTKYKLQTTKQNPERVLPKTPRQTKSMSKIFPFSPHSSQEQNEKKKKKSTLKK